MRILILISVLFSMIFAQGKIQVTADYAALIDSMPWKTGNALTNLVKGDVREYTDVFCDYVKGEITEGKTNVGMIGVLYSPFIANGVVIGQVCSILAEDPRTGFSDEKKPKVIGIAWPMSKVNITQKYVTWYKIKGLPTDAWKSLWVSVTKVKEIK